MQAHSSSANTVDHDSSSIRNRRVSDINRNHKEVSWPANVEGQPRSSTTHDSGQSTSKHPALPWLRNQRSRNRSQTSGATSCRPVPSPSPKYEPGQRSRNMIQQDNPSHKSIADSIVHFSSPQAAEAQITVDAKDFKTDPEKSHSLVATVGEYEALMDEMAAVANDAADYIIATRYQDRGVCSSPSSLDGVDEDMYFTAPTTKHHTPTATTDEVDTSLRRVSTMPAEAPAIPLRSDRRPQTPSSQMSPKTFHQHGAADEFYHPSHKPASPSKVQDLDETKQLRRRHLPDKEVSAGRAPAPWQLARNAQNCDLDVEKQAKAKYDTYTRQPIARKWHDTRKRMTAFVACLNTFNTGFQIGVYAGMVPQIQFQIADQGHYAIQGNVYLYLGMAITTFIFWPLPVLHGRKPYILLASALVIPLQFPQAIVVMAFRSPNVAIFRTALLLSRLLIGLILGFANVNFFTTLLDLFGASLQSHYPHDELVSENDPRRDGGGIGTWLGLWAWCSIGSIAVGFAAGAGIINSMNPQWGFYIAMSLLLVNLMINIVTPETRRSASRWTTRKYLDSNEKVRKLVGRGEVKLHISSTPPKWWWDEVAAGLKLSFSMLRQEGFTVLAIYLGWTYAQVVLVIVLLGSLLSRDYRLKSNGVGGGMMSIAFGALLAVPLSRANWFSRSRTHRPRTDSMTLKTEVFWSSHMARRIIFMLILPFAGMAYTVASAGRSVHYMVPTVFAGVIAFLSNLAITECIGLIMETFDTSDLQPGSNNRHRLSSLPDKIRRRRTNYSSFPRVSAGFFISQAFAFSLAALATGIGRVMTRTLSARLSTGAFAATLLGLTIFLTIVLWRFKDVRVMPEAVFGTAGFGSSADNKPRLQRVKTDWAPVIEGNPASKIRRMNILELGKQSRWTEIRKLNRLI